MSVPEILVVYAQDVRLIKGLLKRANYYAFKVKTLLYFYRKEYYLMLTKKKKPRVKTHSGEA